MKALEKMRKPQILSLYPEGIPFANEHRIETRDDPNGNTKLRKVHAPELEVHVPPKRKGTRASVIICPGGSYTMLDWGKEGVKIAKWFNSCGVTAFVFKYRLPYWEAENCRDKVVLMDAKRAIRLVRSKAKEFDIDPDKTGIIGFSAGGHMVSSISTHFDYGDPSSDLPVEHYSSRPDFAILIYPVITMKEEFAHKMSKESLLGKNPDQELIDYHSSEIQVNSETPPALLIHADNDDNVLPENSIKYYLGLRKFNIPAALHIFEQGGHGFGLAENMGDVEEWANVCKSWMRNRGLL